MTFHPNDLWTILPWAILALVMCVALYFILGRNMGAQGVKGLVRDKKVKLPQMGGAKAIQPPPLPTDLGGASTQTQLITPERNSEIGQLITSLAKDIPGFTIANFYKEVEMSFKGVLEAFAAGDTETLKHWTDETVLKGFLAAIKERKEQNLKLHYKLEKITKLAIANVVETPAAEDSKSVWSIGVDIYSCQTNYLTDAKEDVVQGNAGRTFFQDRWFFEADQSGAGEKVLWKLVRSEVI